MSTVSSRDNTPGTQRPPTRSSQPQYSLPLTQSTRDKLLKDAAKTTNSEDEAITWLQKKIYIPERDSVTVRDLSNAILLLIAHNATTKVLAEGLKAVAICMDQLETERTVARISEAVSDIINPLVEDLKNTINDIAENTMRSINEAGETARCHTTREQMENTHTTEIPLLTPTHPFSYANVLRASLAPHTFSTEHQEVMARGELRNRQVLVDVNNRGSGDTTLKDLSERVLVEKANAALELMVEDRRTQKQWR